MSSPKDKAKTSVNQQVKAGISAVRDFLAGRSGEAETDATEDEATREGVAAELLAAMSGRRPAEGQRENAGDGSSSDTQEIPRFSSYAEGSTNAGAEQTSESKTEYSNAAGQKRARELFLDRGYFDEAVQNLRPANSPAQRAAAARALGVFASQRGVPHLIAATFDDDPEVREAAEEALSQISNPTVADVLKVAVPNNEIDLGEANKVPPVPVADAEALSGATPAVPDVVHDVVPDATRFEIGGNAAGETASAMQPSEEIAAAVSQTDSPANPPPDLTAANETGIAAEEQPLLEEQRIRDEVEGLSLQVLETAAARKKAEQEVQLRIEREASLRDEAAAQRKNEEKLRKRAEQEAEQRRIQEHEALTVELEARAQAETDAQRLVAEEISLRLKVTGLRQTGEELARQRIDQENARREAAEAAWLAEATSARNDAKMRNDAELDRLRSEEEGLRKTTEEAALRRAEVEAAREQADADAARLVEAQARMRTAEEARARADAERSQLEAEINQKVETQTRLLEEARLRGQEEQTRLQEETRRHAEAEQRRLGELEGMKARAEEESRQRAEQERQILGQVDSMRIADAETRKRITDAEVRRRAAEDAYRVVEQQVQRVEAEAHARAKEEEQMLAKLEAERRTVAVEAQSRAAQEKRIREEIELFRRLEEQERPSVEEATLQRKEAEARLQERKDRLKAEEDARNSAAEQLRALEQPHGESFAEQTQTIDEQEAPPVTLPTASVRAAQVDTMSAEVSDTGDDSSAASVTPAITTYLNSVDPYKRAAAVAELARSRPEDAFRLIVNCFDDYSPHVRNAAARALRKLEPVRTVDLFNRALEEASPDRRRSIGAAIAGSGLATEAINNLVSESREDTYNALSLLFVMAKTGEVAPLVQALEEHPADEIGKAVTKLLTLSGHGTQ